MYAAEFDNLLSMMKPIEPPANPVAEKYTVNHKEQRDFEVCWYMKFQPQHWCHYYRPQNHGCNELQPRLRELLQ